jgi:DNA-binding NtrC family response regulator
MIAYSVYIVDDDDAVREAIMTAFQTTYRLKAFPNAAPAIEAIRSDPPDLVLLDIGLPGMNGLEALRAIKGLNPELLVIMITGDEDISSVISAMKAGAHDYVVKPLHTETLEVSIRNALETIRLRKEVQLLQEQCLMENLPCFIGESSAMREMMDFVEAIAKSPDTPVLVIGETGTGKELIASTIHYRSPNFKGPLVTVNCAAIPTELVESELFGYEKGAFTGASLSGKKGLVEEGAGGTLFLDEVGDLSMGAQAKLLRFLEEGEFFRLGGTKPLRVSTRVVSATNKDLMSLIERGTFREDLYYRLSAIKVEVPSLNDHREDILPIASHFLLQFSRKFGKPFTGISPDAAEALKSHAWKGNVRELKNTVERAVLTGKGPTLTLSDIGTIHPDKGTARGGFSFPHLSPAGIDLYSVQESLERHFIEEALKMTGGNESKAASLLRMNHHTFRYRKKKLLGR